MLTCRNVTRIEFGNEPKSDPYKPSRIAKRTSSVLSPGRKRNKVVDDTGGEEKFATSSRTVRLAQTASNLLNEQDETSISIKTFGEKIDRENVTILRYSPFFDVETNQSSGKNWIKPEKTNLGCRFWNLKVFIWALYTENAIKREKYWRPLTNMEQFWFLDR